MLSHVAGLPEKEAPQTARSKLLARLAICLLIKAINPNHTAKANALACGVPTASLARSIGRWSLTALIINGIVGAGIFAVPGKLMATTGRASPIVMALAGLMMGVIVFCYAEVGSQFSEAGGVYLYARTAFGRFAGLQIGWFWFLSALGGAGTSANLFIDHLSGFAPGPETAGHGHWCWRGSCCSPPRSIMRARAKVLCSATCSRWRN